MPRICGFDASRYDIEIESLLIVDAHPFGNRILPRDG